MVSRALCLALTFFVHFPVVGLGVRWGSELMSGGYFLEPLTHFVHFPLWALGLTGV